MTSDIDRRSGWPEELTLLLGRHPRATWAESGSSVASFWLDRHAEFRRHAGAMQATARDYRNDRKSLEQYVLWTAPRLQGFLGALHGHHQIEDFHYFPVFRELHRQLAPGFDVLAKDHEQLHQNIVETAETFNTLFGLLRSADPSPAALARSAEQYHARADLMFGRLTRHLDDEEDLIIPIMLEQERTPDRSDLDA